MAHKQKYSHSKHTKQFSPKHREEQGVVAFVGFIVEMTLYGLIAAYIAVYIVRSQNIHPLYFDFIAGDATAIRDVLQKTAHLDDYVYTFNLWDGSFEQQRADIEYHKNTRIQLIDVYESLLEQFPQSRDLLYNLYVLHTQEENYDKAQDYLQQAQQYDPMLK